MTNDEMTAALRAGNDEMAVHLSSAKRVMPARSAASWAVRPVI
jgi:hypothetical protein